MGGFTVRRFFVATAVVTVILGHLLTCRAFGMGTETWGNGPLNEKNYTEWKGIMPLVNDKPRVYESWVNGDERFLYKGNTKELNAALASFAKVEVKNHVVVLRSGPVVGHSFDNAEIPYNWELHVVGGIARIRANDNIEDLQWQKDPVLTIYVAGDIDLNQIEIPERVTLRSAPDKNAEATKDAAGQKKIMEFLEVRKREAQK